jgi:hypothetical protein
LANAFPLLPHESTAHDPVGVKLYPHCVGVEVTEIHLRFKYMLPGARLNLYFVEA